MSTVEVGPVLLVFRATKKQRFSMRRVELKHAAQRTIQFEGAKLGDRLGTKMYMRKTSAHAVAETVRYQCSLGKKQPPA